MMPSDAPDVPRYPLSTAMRNLENTHLAAVYSPLTPDIGGWIMEQRIWHALQSEWAGIYQNSYHFSPVSSVLGLPVIIAPTMTGITLYNEERGISFNLSDLQSGRYSTLDIKQLPGHIDWLSLIKSGARAVA